MEGEKKARTGVREGRRGREKRREGKGSTNTQSINSCVRRWS